MHVYLRAIKLLFFVATLLLCFCSAMADENEDFIYSVDEDNFITIETYIGSKRNVYIPSEIDGKPVKYIAAAAFEGNNIIAKVHIPGTVVEIGDAAFYNCPNLYRVEFAGNAPIMGYEVFDDCSSSFAVYYYKGSTGFTNPWNGHPCYEIGDEACDKIPGPISDLTFTDGDPIFMGGGNFRNAWTLLDLGEIIPLRFVLQYFPDLKHGSTFYSGRSMFPPWDRKSGFSGNVTCFLSRYIDTDAAGDPEVVDVFLGDRTVVFAQKEGDGWECREPTPYELEKSGDTYFFKDPVGQLVFEFPAREIGSTWIVPYYIIENGNVKRIMDRNGNSLSFEYNGDYLPTRITDNMGRELTFTYIHATYWHNRHLKTVSDNWGRTVTFDYTDITCGEEQTQILSSVTDSMGNRTIFEYQQTEQTEDCHLIKRIIKPMGNNQVEMDWTKNPNEHSAVSSQADGNGNTLNIDYSLEGESIKAALTKADGETKTFVHQDERYPRSFTDEDGNSFTIAYDSAMRRETVTDRLGGETNYAYDPNSGFVSEITNAANNKTQVAYSGTDQTFTDTTGTDSIIFTFYNPTGVEYDDGTNSARAYDNKGNLSSVTDQTGNTWTYTYNSMGQVLTATNPTGGATTYTYNADATLASSTDSDIGSTTYGYDAYKRLNKITHPDGKFIQMAYDLNDRVTSITDENNHIDAYTYDANGNLIKVTDPAGNETRYAYNLMDRVDQVTDRLGNVSTLAYDTIGMIASVTDPNSIQTTFGYNSRGWWTGTTIGDRTWQTGYDDERVISSRTTPLGYQNMYQTDNLGHRTGITNSLNQTTTFTRNALTWITETTDPLFRTTNYTYDSRGLLSGVTLPNGINALYARNDIGLLSGITDLNGNNWIFDYTNIGRMQSSADPLGNTWRHTYDNRGRPGQTTYPDAATLTRTYDDAGNLTRRLYSGGPDLLFTYDGLDRLLTANGLSLSRDAEGRVTATDNPGTIFGATYDDGGRLATATYNNGAFTVTYTYDSTTGLLSRVTDNLTNTQIDFSYDNDMRCTGITRSNGVNSTLSYDNAARLTRIQDGSIDIRYTLDAAGQVTQADMTVPLDPVSLLASKTNAFTYDAASQVSAAGYTYDARGRLTAAPGRTCAWGGASRVTGIDGVTLAYNGLDDLVNRTEDGTTIHYYYNNAIGLKPVVTEKNETTAQFLRYYVWTPGGSLLYMINAAGSNKVYFYHFDRTGSTLALTGASGAVTDSYAYTPYGELLQHNGTSEQPFTFVGKWGVRQEGTSGTLYQMRARYYDAMTGKFLSRDPIWPRLWNPQEINPYCYASNNPTNNIDPRGEGPIRAFLKWLSKKIVGTGAGEALDLPPMDVSDLVAGSTPLGFQEGDPEWGTMGPPVVQLARRYMSMGKGPEDLSSEERIKLIQKIKRGDYLSYHPDALRFLQRLLDLGEPILPPIKPGMNIPQLRREIKRINAGLPPGVYETVESGSGLPSASTHIGNREAVKKGGGEVTEGLLYSEEDFARRWHELLQEGK